MTFVSVNKSLKSFVTTKKWKEFSLNDFIVGEKTECDQTDKFGKPIFGIKVIETNFGFPVGETIYLNCGGNFLNDMNQVEDGEKVKITYGGETKIKKGKWTGQLTHVIKVEVEAAPSSTSVEEDLI